MISIQSVPAPSDNLPYVIDLTDGSSSSSTMSNKHLDRNQSNTRRRKLSKANIERPAITAASSIQLFTINAPRKIPQVTVHRKPLVTPISLEASFSGTDVKFSETSAISALPPDSFAKYMSTFADQSLHVHFSMPASRPGTSRSCKAPRELSLPTPKQLEQAALLSVVGQGGERVAFGELWQRQKTIVIFIRHFWCPLCQDYMASLTRSVPPEILTRAGVKLVIVGNGSHKMIKSYRRIFRTPFQVYTDPTHQIYDILGMTTETNDDPAAVGGYVRHGMLGGIAMVVANALKAGMPVWERGGDISRLGGEFILGPGITCSFAHRMHNPRSHLPVMRLITEAGVDVATPVERPSTPSSKQHVMTEEEELIWMQSRRQSLAALNARKIRRRGGSQWCGGPNSIGNIETVA